MTDFLAQPVHVNILKKNGPISHVWAGYIQNQWTRKGEKGLGLSIILISLITCKIVKLEFECYKLLGFHAKSVRKFTMSWQLRGNHQLMDELMNILKN